MTESATIAIGYIRSHAKKYKINPDVFNKYDIQIHFPEGAVPKDGPSAGVTITTSLISALTNTPVRSDIAMTGEITLRGNILPIGGLKEKSIAAHRSGVKTIFIPKDNEKDLDEIPASVRKDLEIILVDNISKIIDQVLVPVK
jgi:ATP-dependent Lon protease